MDTTTPAGRLIFTIIGAVAAMERELLVEPSQSGLAAARARGRVGGRRRRFTLAHAVVVVVPQSQTACLRVAPPGTDQSLVMTTDWADRNAAWWAKLDHAKNHLTTLTALVNAYKAETPVTVEQDDNLGSDGEVGYVLRIDKPVPVAISLVVGDVLHNLRSGFDALVYGMVEDALGPLTNKQARVCKFPICLTPDAFANFAAGDIAPVWSERLRYALHGAQPYYHEEQARTLGIPLSPFSYEDLSRLETIWAISSMNNIDKHRRVAVAAWWPSVVYWFLLDGSEPQNWRPGDGTFTDGSVVGYASGGGATGPQEVRHEFNLVLTDLPTHRPSDPTSSTDVLASVGSWVWGAEFIVGEVIRSWVEGPLS